MNYNSHNSSVTSSRCCLAEVNKATQQANVEMRRYFQTVEKNSAKRQRVNERNENAPGNTNKEMDVNVTDVKGKT